MNENITELNLNMTKTLNMMKGYRVGSTSAKHDKFIVNFGENQFVISIEEVEKIDNIFGAIDKYLK